jgi:TIR domain
MLTSSPPEVFISYSYKDEELFKQFEKYLSVLARKGKIKTWHGRQIPPGDKWQEVIDEHIKSANLVLLLVSVDFLVSEYCISVEFAGALKRYAIEATHIIPIILKPCPWPGTPIGEFQVLPRDGDLASSKDTAKAFLDVSDEIEKLIESVRKRLERITITTQTTQNDFYVEDLTASLRDDVGVNRDRVEISVHGGGNKVRIDGADQELQRIVNALSDPVFRRQITGGIDLKSITYIEDGYLRSIPLEPPPGPGHRPVLKYALLLAAIAVVVITVKSFVSWSQPRESYLYSPTPSASAPSLPTPTVMPSPTSTIPTGVQITITKIPPYDASGGRDSKGHIAGKVSGLKTNNYYVVIYAFTTMWYVQPTTANPMTEIKPGGTWEADIQLGSRYVALVVPPDYNPPYAITSPPTNLKGIVAATEVAEK